MIDFYLKKGDVLPVIRMELQDSNSNAVNLSGAAVAFNYKLRTSGTIINRSSSVESDISGICQYTWVTGDTQVPGVYMGEFVVSFSNGKQMTFPPGNPIIFEVVDDIS